MCEAVCAFLGRPVRLSSWEEEPCQMLCLWAVLDLCWIFLLPRVAPWLRGRVVATALHGLWGCLQVLPSLALVSTATKSDLVYANQCISLLARSRWRPSLYNYNFPNVLLVGVASYNVNSAEHYEGKCSELFLWKCVPCCFVMSSQKPGRIKKKRTKWKLKQALVFFRVRKFQISVSKLRNVWEYLNEQQHFLNFVRTLKGVYVWFLKADLWNIQQKMDQFFGFIMFWNNCIFSF